MGKVVKFCASCEESFAEKFGFCPTCGATLDAFEMNPVGKAEPVVEASPVETAPIEEPIVEAALEPVDEVETVIEEPIAAATPVPEKKPIYTMPKAVDADAYSTASTVDTYSADVDDDAYRITVIEEKNGKQRNSLLLGALASMIVVLLAATVFSIFNRDYDIGAVNDGIFNALLLEDVPMTVEEEQIKKEKDKGGGGGGGGREEEQEVNKGDLADQSKNPTRPPDPRVHRSDNFDLKMPPPQTEGNMKFPKENKVWGDPNGRFSTLSSGPGSGGGQGSGRGEGQGSGNGSGAGSGNGSGFGSGDGDGNGDGSGSGGRGGPPPPPPAGVTKAFAIVSKPRAPYTDAARRENAQGTVVLKVTFLASGQIGSISTVRGMPYGLTESAIAAARRITFTPKMVNGVPQTISKTVEYGFTIY